MKLTAEQVEARLSLPCIPLTSFLHKLHHDSCFCSGLEGLGAPLDPSLAPD